MNSESPSTICLLYTWTLSVCHKWTAAVYIIFPPCILSKGHQKCTGCSLVQRALKLQHYVSSLSKWINASDLISDAGLQLAIQEGGVVNLQAGVDDRGVVSHPAPVCPAVAPLDLVKARHLLQAQNVLKALLEVVRKEGVQDGVGAAVGVAEHHHKVEGALHGRRGLDGAGDGRDVENVKGQPAEDEHRHHDGNHPRHLTLGALALCGAHSYAGWLDLEGKWTVGHIKYAPCNVNIVHLSNTEIRSWCLGLLNTVCAKYFFLMQRYKLCVVLLSDKRMMSWGM